MTFRKISTLLILTGIMLFYSCDRKRIYESYNPISDGQWLKDSVITYNCEIKDALLPYNLFMNLRNSVDYPYSNIWMFVTISPPQGVTRTDTIEFALADASGKWFGKGYGKFRDNKLPYKNNIYFPVAGAYQIEIRHGMRNNILEGISDVGIRIEKTR